ncbi:hypothetical protein Tco_0341204 [Tanacetum coccineum]
MSWWILTDDQGRGSRRLKPLEFEVGDMVMLKVSPWKGAMRFRKRENLVLPYIEPFKIVARVGLVEPVEIVDKEVKRFKQSQIPIVKVHWNSQRGPEFTWERGIRLRRSTLISLQDASKRGRINAIDADEYINLVNVQDDADKEMYDVGIVTGDEVFAEQEVVAKDVNLTVDEVTLAQALAALKSVKPKVKRDVIEEPNVPVNATSASTKAEVQDKGKGKMNEPEPVKKMSKKDQLRSDEEEAKRLQAEFDEEERLAREKTEKEQEANVALTKEWDDIQAKIEADHELAQRLQAEEQEEFAEEKRNKPPTQAQQRKIMCTYLKNMEGKKLKDLKNKSFDYIQKMFDRAFKRANTFQKVDEDKDTAELQSLMEVIPDKEEVAIDVVPLATKPLTIVDRKIHKEGKNNYFQIIRADGSSKMYLVFSQLLKSVDREDLVELYKLVKAKYGLTRPVEDMDLLLWGDLKTMFEPHAEDEIWKLQQRYKVLSWKLFDSCGVHCLSLQSGMIYILVEKRYPLTPPTITDMLNKKLQYKVNVAEGVNAASEEVSTAELVSCYEGYNRGYWLLRRLPHRLQAAVKAATKIAGCCGGCHIV